MLHLHQHLHTHTHIHVYIHTHTHTLDQSQALGLWTTLFWRHFCRMQTTQRVRSLTWPTSWSSRRRSWGVGASCWAWRLRTRRRRTSWPRPPKTGEMLGHQVLSSALVLSFASVPNAPDRGSVHSVIQSPALLIMSQAAHRKTYFVVPRAFVSWSLTHFSYHYSLLFYIVLKFCLN